MRFKHLRITVLLIAVLLFTGKASAQIRLLTIGNAPMADYDADTNIGANEKRGWAQMLPYFLADNVQVENAARIGQSSKSFYYTYWVSKLLNTLKINDVVVIQFGGNDEKAAFAASSQTASTDSLIDQYGVFLRRYIEDCRQKKAIPILATPVILGATDETFAANYALAVKRVAQSMNVPLVDMRTLTGQLIKDYGASARQELYCPNNNSYLSALGALLYASVFAKEMVNYNILPEMFSFMHEARIVPKNLNFGTQKPFSRTIKVLAVEGVEAQSIADIRISTSSTSASASPVKISLSPDSAFVAGLHIVSNVADTNSFTNYYLPIYVRYSPTQRGDWQSTLDVSIDGRSAQHIPLSAICADTASARSQSALLNVTAPSGNTVVERQLVQPVEGQVLLNPNQSSLNYYLLATNGNFRVNFNFENLYYFFNSAANNPVLTITNNTWPAERQRNAGRYFGLTFTAQDSITLKTISFAIQSIGASDFKFDAIGYASWNPAAPDLYASGIKLDGNGLQHFSYNVNIKLKSGQSYALRIYPWSELGGIRKSILLDNITMDGTSEMAVIFDSSAP